MYELLCHIIRKYTTSNKHPPSLPQTVKSIFWYTLPTPYPLPQLVSPSSLQKTTHTIALYLPISDQPQSCVIVR